MYPATLKVAVIHLVMLCAVASSVAQTVDLSGEWRFKKGDDASWRQPDLVDTDWQPISTGSPWEQQGHPDYDGFAWYRRRFTVPTALRDAEAFALTQSLLLSLGRVDDVDETWFNGQRVGGHGTFPPNYAGDWQARRSYVVPNALVRWGEANVLAVRVYDGSGMGGLLGRRPLLRAATWREVVRLEWEPGLGDGLFTSPRPIAFQATLHNDSSRALSGDLHWSVEDDEGQELSRSTVAVALPAGRATPAVHSFQPSSPGFYKFVATLEPVDGTTLLFSKFTGYLPESIEAPLTREADFDAFWKETLAALAAVDPQFAVERKNDRDSATHEVYEIAMRSLGDVRVRGWYEKPKTGTRFPVLLRVPGYGQNMRPTGSDAPIAFFSFNVRGHGNSQQDVSGLPANYWIRGLDDNRGYYYQGAYADCVRAVDFLAGRSELDPKRIGVTGGSQGGGLSLATAALDPRISLCAPNIPFLCDWVKYFKASHWPEMDKWIEARPERTWETTLKTMSYFDTLNMADRIRCPVLFSLGVQDPVCPPSTVFSVYNRLGGRKEFRAYPNDAHRVNGAHRAVLNAWIGREFSRPAK